MVVYTWDPATSGMYPTCPSRALTGWLCPGCGTLRALHQLLHGHVGLAFRHNPLAMVALPFVAYALLREGLEAWRGTGLPGPRTWHGWPWILLVVIVAYGIARNVGSYPFTLLAPP